MMSAHLFFIFLLLLTIQIRRGNDLSVQATLVGHAGAVTAVGYCGLTGVVFSGGLDSSFREWREGATSRSIFTDSPAVSISVEHDICHVGLRSGNLIVLERASFAALRTIPFFAGKPVASVRSTGPVLQDFFLCIACAPDDTKLPSLRVQGFHRKKMTGKPKYTAAFTSNSTRGLNMVTIARNLAFTARGVPLASTASLLAGPNKSSASLVSPSMQMRMTNNQDVSVLNDANFANETPEPTASSPPSKSHAPSRARSLWSKGIIAAVYQSDEKAKASKDAEQRSSWPSPFRTALGLADSQARAPQQDHTTAEHAHGRAPQHGLTRATGGRAKSPLNGPSPELTRNSSRNSNLGVSPSRTSLMKERQRQDSPGRSRSGSDFETDARPNPNLERGLEERVRLVQEKLEREKRQEDEDRKAREQALELQRREEREREREKERQRELKLAEQMKALAIEVEHLKQQREKDRAEIEQLKQQVVATGPTSASPRASERALASFGSYPVPLMAMPPMNHRELSSTRAQSHAEPAHAHALQSQSKRQLPQLLSPVTSSRDLASIKGERAKKESMDPRYNSRSAAGESQKPPWVDITSTAPTHKPSPRLVDPSSSFFSPRRQAGTLQPLEYKPSPARIVAVNEFDPALLHTPKQASLLHLPQLAVPTPTASQGDPSSRGSKNPSLTPALRQGPSVSTYRPPPPVGTAAAEPPRPVHDSSTVSPRVPSGAPPRPSIEDPQALLDNLRLLLGPGKNVRMGAGGLGAQGSPRREHRIVSHSPRRLPPPGSIHGPPIRAVAPGFIDPYSQSPRHHRTWMN